MKRIVCISISLLLLLAAHAQDFTYVKADKVYTNSGKGNRYTNLENAVMTDKGILGIYATHKSKYDTKYFNDDEAILRLFDKNLNIILEKDFAEGRGDINIIDLVKSNGKIFCVYVSPNGEVLELNIAEINPATLEVTNDRKNIISFNHKKNLEVGSAIQVLHSGDRSKYLVYYETWAVQHMNSFTFSPKNPQPLQYIVFDNSMNKIYSKDYVFPYKNREMRYKSFVAGNDGSLNVLYYYFPGGNNTDLKDRSDGEIVATYELKLKRLQEKIEIDYNIGLDGKFIETITMDEWPSTNQYIIGGIYKDTYKDRANGVFMSQINADKKDFKIKTFPFAAEFDKGLSKRTIFTNPTLGGATEGIFSRSYLPLKFVKTGNSMFMFSQYFWLRSTVTARDHWTYLTGDVLITRFDKSGESTTANLSLPGTDIIQQETENIFFNNDDLFIFLGVIGERKEEALSYIKITAEGKVSKEDVFKMDDQEVKNIGRRIVHVTDKDLLMEGAKDSKPSVYWLKMK